MINSFRNRLIGAFGPALVVAQVHSSTEREPKETVSVDHTPKAVPMTGTIKMAPLSRKDARRLRGWVSHAEHNKLGRKRK